MKSGMKALAEMSRGIGKGGAGGGGKYLPFLSLQDGDSILVLFNGNEDEEPFLSKKHSIKLGGDNFASLMCSKGHPSTGGKCVACYAIRHKAKHVGLPARQATFNVADLRMVHKVLDKFATKKRGRDTFKQVECTEDASCKYCMRDSEAERGGQKRFDMNSIVAQVFMSVVNEMAKKCTCGGVLKITGYRDSKTGKLASESTVEAILSNPDDESNDRFEPVHKCSKCKNPVPRTPFNTVMRVKVSGSMRTKSVSFLPEYDIEIEDWMREDPYEAVSLKDSVTPLSLDQQADKIGIDNPFEDGDEDDEDTKKKSKRRAKDEDDEDDEDDDDEDDDEDERPKAKAPASKAKERPVAKKYADSDDEDEEDEDEDEDEDEEPAPRKKASPPAARSGVKIKPKAKQKDEDDDDDIFDD